ncbi:hypothetical protein [Haladaptatus caseinilyticus]|uniref:hypothetical protein n=1 Tax=Haladaptatus caseinilyticus TaxID=2993314 RepID=UPI00224B2CA4|nr:hypothetical protein [Haladaptatus caseinilyticus]
MVVYTTNTDGFATVAERIAADRDERLVTDLATATASNEHVLYVDDPANITENTALTFQQRLLDRGVETGSFSIITGYTPELAEKLYFDKVENNGEDLLSFMRQPPEGAQTIKNATVLERDEVTVGALKDLTSEPLRSFGINANGRTIHISISDGFICGNPISQSVKDYSGRQPFCVEDGEVNCPIADDLISAESIDAAHLAILSCSSTLPNATSDLPILPSLGLLDGADSLIGAYRVAPSWPYELLLHHVLLMSGYDLNERCYLLNKNSHVNGIMGYPYLAYGRPDAKIDTPYTPDFDLEYHADVGELSIHLSAVDGYVCDFTVPKGSAPAYDERLYVRNEGDTDIPLYYLAFEDDAVIRVILFSGGKMQTDLDVAISGDYAHRLKRDVMVDSIRNMTKTEATGFFGTEITDRVSEIRKEARNLPKQTEAERFDANRHGEMGSAVNSVYGQVNSIRESLVSMLRAKGDFPLYNYAGSMRDDEVYASEHTCPICSVRPLFIKQVASWDGENKRLFCACPRCGVVFDVPTTKRDPAPQFPLVETNLGDAGVSDPILTIQFENEEDVPLQATFLPIVIHLDNEENEFFDPGQREVVLAPGESHTAEFDVNADEFPDNMYYIMGVVIANMSIYAGFTTIVIGDRGAYYPGHLR